MHEITWRGNEGVSGCMRSVGWEMKEGGMGA